MHRRLITSDLRVLKARSRLKLSTLRLQCTHSERRGSTYVLYCSDFKALWDRRHNRRRRPPSIPHGPRSIKPAMLEGESKVLGRPVRLPVMHVSNGKDGIVATGKPWPQILVTTTPGVAIVVCRGCNWLAGPPNELLDRAKQWFVRYGRDRGSGCRPRAASTTLTPASGIRRASFGPKVLGCRPKASLERCESALEQAAFLLRAPHFPMRESASFFPLSPPSHSVSGPSPSPLAISTASW